MIRVTTTVSDDAWLALPLRLTVEATIEEWLAIERALVGTKEYHAHAERFRVCVTTHIRNLREALNRYSADGGEE